MRLAYTQDTNTVFASYNVSSVVDNTAGQFTTNFTNGYVNFRDHRTEFDGGTAATGRTSRLLFGFDGVSESTSVSYGTHYNSTAYADADENRIVNLGRDLA